MAQKAKVFTEELWASMKNSYVIEGKGYRALAKTYQVPYSQIRSRANGEDWSAERDAYKKLVQEKALDKIADDNAEKISKAFRVADKILDKLELSVELLVPEDRDGLIKCANTLKSLKEIGVFRAELDMLEQQARIDKLRKDAASDEKKDNTLIVRFEGDIDEYGD